MTSSAVSSGAKRRLKPTISRSLPVFAMTSTIRSSSSRVSARGFSTKTAFPVSQSAADQVRVRVMAGHDEDRVQGLVFEHGVGAGGSRGEAETPLGVDRGQRPGRRDMRQVGVRSSPARRGSSVDGGVVAGADEPDRQPSVAPAARRRRRRWPGPCWSRHLAGCPRAVPGTRAGRRRPSASPRPGRRRRCSRSPAGRHRKRAFRPRSPSAR